MYHIISHHVLNIWHRLASPAHHTGRVAVETEHQKDWYTDDLLYVMTNWKPGRQPALCQLFHGTRAPCGPDRLHCRGLTITLRYTTFGRTSLDESSKTSTWQHTTRTRYYVQLPPAGFEPTIPTSERRLTHALSSAATGNGCITS
jgi:hypothetical protein